MDRTIGSRNTDYKRQRFWGGGETRDWLTETQISTIKNQFIAETAESQDSVLTGSVWIVWGAISSIKLGFLIVFKNLNPSLIPRQKKAMNSAVVTLTRCKLGPVSNALRAINVLNPARPGSTTFETKYAHTMLYLKHIILPSPPANSKS